MLLCSTFFLKYFICLQSQNDWLRQYLKIRQSLLFEMMRLEAPPPDRMCTHCKVAPGTYRCKDCFLQNFYCDQCSISTHSKEPFHRIQKFSNGYFAASDLADLGLLLDIRPHSGDCLARNTRMSGYDSADDPNDEEAWEDDDDDTVEQGQDSFTFGREHRDVGHIVVVASTGIFNRSVKWCSCPNAPAKHIQLLRSRLFPATFAQPKTAFTFEVLDHFRLDALECNTSALNFMSKLTRRTNEVFPGTVPVGRPLEYPVVLLIG